jgi:DNA-binding NarL/FixJ family response regulator
MLSPDVRRISPPQGGATVTDAGEVASQRVLVVDDHHTFAELLAGALDREPDLVTVGRASTGQQAVDMCAQLRPDVVLMDVQLPDIDGFAATAAIVAMQPGVRVLLLTAIVTAAVAARAASSGACGFLAKEGHLEDMLKAIRSSRPGGFAVDPALLIQLSRRQTAGGLPPSRQLTDRELDVLHLLGDGHDVATISRRLGISSNTCRGHVKSLLSKLDAHSQLEAVVLAVRHGLVRIGELPHVPGRP